MLHMNYLKDVSRAPYVIPSVYAYTGSNLIFPLQNHENGWDYRHKYTEKEINTETKKIGGFILIAVIQEDDHLTGHNLPIGATDVDSGI